jgi:hypothetical protein
MYSLFNSILAARGCNFYFSCSAAMPCGTLDCLPMKKVFFNLTNPFAFQAYIFFILYLIEYFYRWTISLSPVVLLQTVNKS